MDFPNFFLDFLILREKNPQLRKNFLTMDIKSYFSSKLSKIFSSFFESIFL
jgi:hypothetical protein